MFTIAIPTVFRRSNSVCLSPVSKVIESFKENPKEFYAQMAKNKQTNSNEKSFQ